MTSPIDYILAAINEDGQTITRKELFDLLGPRSRDELLLLFAECTSPKTKFRHKFYKKMKDERKSA